MWSIFLFRSLGPFSLSGSDFRDTNLFLNNLFNLWSNLNMNKIRYLYFLLLRFLWFQTKRVEPLSLCVVAQFMNKYEPYQTRSSLQSENRFQKTDQSSLFSIDTLDITMLHWNHRGQAEALFVLCWLSGSVQNSVHHDNSFCYAVWCPSFYLFLLFFL